MSHRIREAAYLWVNEFGFDVQIRDEQREVVVAQRLAKAIEHGYRRVLVAAVHQRELHRIR